MKMIIRDTIKNLAVTIMINLGEDVMIVMRMKKVQVKSTWCQDLPYLRKRMMMRTSNKE